MCGGGKPQRSISECAPIVEFGASGSRVSDSEGLKWFIRKYGVMEAF
jgi:hypothetical protein